MYFSERNTLSNIDWSNEDHVCCQLSDGTQVKIVLVATQFTGQWRESNASGSCPTLRSGCSTNTVFVEQPERNVEHEPLASLSPHWPLDPEDNDATNDSELQSNDSEDPDDSEDADTPSDSSGMGDLIEHSYKVLFVPDTDVECVTVQSK